MVLQTIEQNNLLFNKRSRKTGNAMEFLKYLQQLELGKRLAIFWDEVTYYNPQEFREYLITINQEKPE